MMTDHGPSADDSKSSPARTPGSDFDEIDLAPYGG
jgi:hypothetical protein